jgi:hypothetical protein
MDGSEMNLADLRREALREAITARSAAEEKTAQVRDALARAHALVDEMTAAIARHQRRHADQGKDAAAALAEALRRGEVPSEIEAPSDHAALIEAEARHATALAARDHIAAELAVAEAALRRRAVAVETAASAVALSEVEAIADDFIDAQFAADVLRTALEGFDGPLPPRVYAALAPRAEPPPAVVHPRRRWASAWAEFKAALAVNADAIIEPIDSAPLLAPRPAFPRVTLSPRAQRDRIIAASRAEGGIILEEKALPDGISPVRL